MLCKKFDFDTMNEMEAGNKTPACSEVAFLLKGNCSLQFSYPVGRWVFSVLILSSLGIDIVSYFCFICFLLHGVKS